MDEVGAGAPGVSWPNAELLAITLPAANTVKTNALINFIIFDLESMVLLIVNKFGNGFECSDGLRRKKLQPALRGGELNHSAAQARGHQS